MAEQQSPDIHNNTPAIVEKAPKGGNLRGVPDDIKQILALNGYIDISELYKQQEEKVTKIVLEKTLKSAIEKGQYKEGIDTRKIDDNVFSVKSKKTGNVSMFVNEKGDIILSVSGLNKREFVNNGKVFEDLGVVQKTENGVLNTYKIQGKKVSNDGSEELILEGPINQESKEYYKLLKDFLFHADLYDKYFMLKNGMKDTKEGILFFAENGAYKLEDLELFKSKGLIDDELFNIGVQELRKIVVSQCSDTRLIKLGIGIKESDIKRYLEKGYIDKDLAAQCFKVLPEEMKDLSGKK